jgi:CMP-N-acetylneuraminic acid synthetase
MIGSLKVLAVIPARAGSVGLPDKNIRQFHGKALLAWTIEAAKACDYIDQILVSTDSRHYADIAQQHGVNTPFLRREQLSGSNASLIDVLQHAVAELKSSGMEFDVLVCLQPTSPLRTAVHIKEALELFQSIADPDKSIASVFELPQKFAWVLQTNTEGQLRFLDSSLQSQNNYRRQHNSAVYMPNGAIFIMQTTKITSQYTEHTYPYVMPEQASADIDTLADFAQAEHILKSLLL